MCLEIVVALCKCMCCSSCSRAVHSEVPFLNIHRGPAAWKTQSKMHSPKKIQECKNEMLYNILFRHQMVQALLVFHCCRGEWNDVLLTVLCEGFMTLQGLKELLGALVSCFGVFGRA